MEPSSNVLHRELLDGGNNTEAAVGTSNGETENGGVGLETTSVARQTRIERVTDTPAAGLDSSISVLAQAETWKSGNSSQCELARAAKEKPWSESQRCALPGQKCSEPLPSMTNGEVRHGRNEMEPHIGECNGETEGRSSIGLGTVPDVSRRECIENLGESPSSRLASPSCVSVQPQACTITGNSSSFGQSMNLTVLTSQEVRQNDSPLAVPSCQTISPLQLSVGCDTRSASILTGAPILRPANSYYQETSSLRCDVSPPTGCDPLQNELVKMRKEEAAAIKVHIDQVKLFKSACEMEMEEIQKKYESLVREAENTLVQKKRI
ncbi:hypothetical protein Cgig2_001665 [Carnegiea gigantea]|uniref:Uncharacterized protein n=1 Tax=Carnegiea gigantea TaxID=171969 RepID=A0A9Q1JYC5_9CARY|nr:hypothetical protein Cgig2_001665 [Carnegiea gigantea]